MEPEMDVHAGRRQEAANDAAAGVSAACQWGWPQHTNGSDTEMTHQSAQVDSRRWERAASRCHTEEMFLMTNPPKRLHQPESNDPWRDSAKRSGTGEAKHPPCGDALIFWCVYSAFTLMNPQLYCDGVQVYCWCVCARPRLDLRALRNHTDIHVFISHICGALKPKLNRKYIYGCVLVR